VTRREPGSREGAMVMVKHWPATCQCAVRSHTPTLCPSCGTASQVSPVPASALHVERRLLKQSSAIVIGGDSLVLCAALTDSTVCRPV
jgi:hypothetical protein